MTALSQFAHKSPKLSGSHQTEPVPVRAKSTRGSPVAARPCRRAGATGAGPCHDPRAAVARPARPDRDGGDAGLDHDAPSGSSEVPPRLATDVDAGRGVGADPGPSMRGPP